MAEVVDDTDESVPELKEELLETVDAADEVGALLTGRAPLLI